MSRAGMLIGVLGAGQLGRMLALAGLPLGLRFRFFDPAPNSPASALGEQIGAGYDDLAALERFAAGLDVITYEFENVPVTAARTLAGWAPVYPPPQALEVSQDRLVEKQFFQRLGIPTPAFAAVNSPAEIASLWMSSPGLLRRSAPRNDETVTAPMAVLKTRRLGYDGKGQVVLRSAAEAEAAWQALAGDRGEADLILEAWQPFEREVSLLMARGRDGQMVAYPLVENQHRAGILRQSVCPARGAAGLQAEAEAYGRAVLAALEYVGLLAIEFFLVQGRLVANEMAPRVHNSGHWSIEGAQTSQFENHLRAVCGLPLGSTVLRGAAGMLNLIGTTPDLEELLACDGLHLHLYDKSPRPGRKLGHLTVVEKTAAQVRRRLDMIKPDLETPAAAMKE